MNDYPHIVGAGLPRTGTTTLRAALKILGFPKDKIHVGDQIVLNGWNHYQKLDNLYPQGKTIYTKRESPEKWLSSVMSRTKVIGGNESILRNRERMYGSRTVVPELYLPKYWKREVDVTGYFQDKYHADWKDKLLVIAWEENSGEENWRLLCNFLFMEIPDIEFPHKNKSKT